MYADGTVKAVKWYPAGATTNSGAGVKETDLEIVLPTLKAMAEVLISYARARAAVRSLSWRPRLRCKLVLLRGGDAGVGRAGGHASALPRRKHRPNL